MGGYPQFSAISQLFGMLRRYEELTARPEHLELERDEFLGLLIDAEATWRDNSRMQRLLRNARLKQTACLEDIDYRHPRGLHRPTMLELAEGHCLKNRRNVLISGPTGVGKSFIACALGNSVCRAGRSVFYVCRL